jgi:hypothetical protein
MYEFTPADPTIKRPSTMRVEERKRRIIYGFIPLVMFVATLANVVLGETPLSAAFGIVGGIVLNVFELMWARLDAEDRNYELSKYFTFAVVLFGVFAITYYLVRSRDTADSLRAIGLMIIYFVVLVVVLGVATGIIAAILVAVGVLPQNVLEEP